MSRRKELAAMFGLNWARTVYIWLGVFWSWLIYGTYVTFF